MHNRGLLGAEPAAADSAPISGREFFDLQFSFHPCPSRTRLFFPTILVLEPFAVTIRSQQRILLINPTISCRRARMETASASYALMLTLCHRLHLYAQKLDS